LLAEFTTTKNFASETIQIS